MWLLAAVVSDQCLQRVVVVLLWLLAAVVSDQCLQLARKALKLNWADQHALKGAAQCNLGTYLSMQGRHEQAANELERGAVIMG